MSIWLGNKRLDGGSARNVGDIFYTTRRDSGLGGAVECNGGTYDTRDYTGAGSIGELLAAGKLPYTSLADYAQWITDTGSCSVFGWDGGTSFRVPTLRDIFIEATNSSSGEVNWYKAAGLPNITAQAGGIMHNGGLSESGAFNGSSTSSTFGHSSGNYDNVMTLRFNANKSNSIYGNSDTVQPKAIKYRAMVQLFNSTTDEAVATVGTIVADVSGLKDMSNITATGKETVVGWGMPDYSAGVTITSGVDFTPNTDGYIMVKSNNTKWPSVSISVYVNNNWKALQESYCSTNDTSGILSISVLATKGFTYKTNGNGVFYPMIGA